MLRALVLFGLAAAGCAESDDANAPLATDYLPARSREEAAPLTCAEIDGSKGRSAIVVAEGSGFVIARLGWREAANACREVCGANQRMATTKEIAAVRDDPDTTLTAGGIRFGGKRARAVSRHYWVSADAFTDPYRHERKDSGATLAADDGEGDGPEGGDEPAPRYAVMCTTGE